MAIVTTSPLAIPRFYTAAMYIPLLLLLLPFFKKSNFFSLVLVFAVSFVFPFINQFRNFTGRVDFRFDLDVFTEGHFDSYQNFALIFFGNFITGGRQLLGVLLFWIPRSIWANKPVGSGHYLAEQLGMKWQNISANFFAEGYINFGLVGIIIFTLFLAWITAITDSVYWVLVHSKKNNYLKVIYYILLSMLFFVMRGDLMSSFAFTVSFIVAALMIFKLLTFKL